MSAIVLANERLRTPYAKTAHGLIRGPSRYAVHGVVDPATAGQDAGALLDGVHRGIPIYGSVQAALDGAATRPTHCVVGVATSGGRLPPGLRDSLLTAADAGLVLVNGLHELLEDDAAIVELTRRRGGGIIDLRRPRPPSSLHFWSGSIYAVNALRVAVLGTDCAIGKRTTALLLQEATTRRGIKTEIIYTGQTGWLQGLRFGFILDATPNDFVSGELERAIVECAQEVGPDLILIEGQSALRNPAGPCGSELILSGAVQGVVLQHAPARRYFEGLEDIGRPIPPLREEIDLVRLLGSTVLGVTLNARGMSPNDGEMLKVRLAKELGLPVSVPLQGGVDEVAEALFARLSAGGAMQ